MKCAICGKKIEKSDAIIVNSKTICIDCFFA